MNTTEYQATGMTCGHCELSGREEVRTVAGSYTVPKTFPATQIPMGSATGSPVRSTSGIWSRTCASGWAAVNPTRSTVTATRPSAASTSGVAASRLSDCRRCRARCCA